MAVAEERGQRGKPRGDWGGGGYLGEVEIKHKQNNLPARPRVVSSLDLPGDNKSINF